MSKFVKPSFFVIGAQKAGTTTLHDWLSQHPQICLPKIKETHFFSETERYQRGFEWYAAQFSKKKNPCCIFGEVDPDYLFFSEVETRIQQVAESPKFIVILREPLRRAYSHYLMTRRRGYESLSFGQALNIEEKRCETGDRYCLDNFSYLARGLYASQILRIRKAFPFSKVLFLKFDDLFNNHSEDVFKQICSFIGVDYCYDRMKINFSKKSNQSSVPRFIFLRDFIYKSSRLKKFLGRMIIIPSLKLRIAMWLDEINTVPERMLNGPGWDDEVAICFHRLLIRECEKIAELTGVCLDDWIAYHKEATLIKSSKNEN